MDLTVLRTYGHAPFRVAVVHGGPGARGEMAPVATALSGHRGVLEPLQTADSIEGQVNELVAVLCRDGEAPVTLIGHSWGAWLSFIVAARYSKLVAKVIMVGAGPFEEQYTAKLMDTRLGRLSETERHEVNTLRFPLESQSSSNKIAAFARFGELISKADSFDSLEGEGGGIEVQPEAFESVWNEAKEMRHSGELLRLGENIRCPVIAVHGDYDSHPADGVRLPLSKILRDFRFELIQECGHTPWLERRAQARFYEIVESELGEHD